MSKKEPEEDKKFVIMVGNIIDGLHLVGPFDDGNDANEHADHEFRKEEWIVASMEAPPGDLEIEEDDFRCVICGHIHPLEKSVDLDAGPAAVWCVEKVKKHELVPVQVLITERMVVQKEVTIYVKPSIDPDELNLLARSKACERTAFSDDDTHGWECVSMSPKSVHHHISERNMRPGQFCPSCGAEHSGEDVDGGRCTKCGTYLCPLDPKNLRDEDEYKVINMYHHCGMRWSAPWSCVCDDKCPECGHEVPPYTSKEI